jgi:ubiquinol-cytochrome c reductase cytochrome c subunit
MPLTAAGRADAPGTPIRPLPGKTLGDPDATAVRHDPAYSPDTISALVDYVADVAGGGGPDIPSPAAGDVANGGELFRLQCAACHEWAGDGGALFQREAPSLHTATPVQVAEAVRVGPGQMPTFGQAALTDGQVNDVVSYVSYLDAPNDRGGADLGHVGPVAEGAVALAGVLGLALLLRWIGQRG